MKTIVYVTDLYYPAAGRQYYEEDLFLTSFIRKTFPLVLCNPRDIEQFENSADLIVWRNTGPVAGYKQAYSAFRARVSSRGLKTFNSFDGKADMNGKQYLVDLARKGYPVIPTADTSEGLSALPDADEYILKPKDGADSAGLRILKAGEVINTLQATEGSALVQPFIDFEYEVSFYYINRQYQYALYAPDKARRWELMPYEATDEDIAFASRFIDWNNLRCGIQRVDACRQKNGELLLVELEDLNPYLSLSLLDEQTRDRFIADFLDPLRAEIER